MALLMPSHRGIREFRLVAPAHAHRPCLVALAVAVEGEREAAVEQLNRQRHLVLVPVPGERFVDQLPLDPAPLEVARDALAAPAVEEPSVLGAPPGVAGVVNKALGGARRDRVVNEVPL